MNTMTYKNYHARIDFSEEDDCFVGHVAGIRDVVGFHADTVSALRAAFIEAVDDYLATCVQLGRSPQRSYSGRVMLRIPPEIHAKAAGLAERAGESLNQWMEHLVAAAK